MQLGDKATILGQEMTVVRIQESVTRELAPCASFSYSVEPIKVVQRDRVFESVVVGKWFKGEATERKESQVWFALDPKGKVARDFTVIKMVTRRLECH